MPAVLDRRFQIETEHPKKNGHQLASSSGKSRATPVVDLAAIEQAVRTILEAVGEDPDRDGLLETPRRVARMYAEMFSGLTQDPARHLRVTFPEDYD